MTPKENAMKNDLLKLAASGVRATHDTELVKKLREYAPHWFPTPNNDNTKKAPK